MKLLLTLCSLAIFSVAFAEFPLQKCKNGDSACLTKIGNEILEKYYEGLPEYHLVPLDPLHIKKMIFERDVHGPVSIDVTLTDVDLIGFKNMKFTAIKGFQADLSGRTELIATIPELRLKGHYKIDGQILVLPIKGEGDMEIVISGAQSNYSFDMKPNEKKGKIHAVVEHVKFNIEPDQIKFRLDNLFNGDKTLGDNINLFLNENWRELYAETKTNLLKPSSIVMKNIINSFLDNHPYEHFFE